MLLLGFGLAACGRDTQAPRWSGLSGDSGRGAHIIEQTGCGQCHTIPGIPGAAGVAGPPLTRFAAHTTIAGLLPNTPHNLTLWIRFPQKVLPGNVMPDMGLSENQAQDAAAYLETLN